MPIMDEEQKDKIGVKLTKNVIKASPDPRAAEIMKYKAELLGKVWTIQPTVSGMMEMAGNMTTVFRYQCERVLNDDLLMKKLQDEKFDVGFAEVISICGFGIFEVAKIPASIATVSVVYKDIASAAIGEPINPSFVPGAYSNAGDHMNFVDRVKNAVELVLGRKLFANIFESEMSAFKEKFGQNFEGYNELIAKASYVMTNSNPYLDYPRPMLHKTVCIGGIAVSVDSKKNKLSEEWDAILNERSSTVLVSFGTMAKAVYMPDKYM
ncbi:hypothetical protein OESDEN_10869 [Oesophagostomum dentatum]|uniref:glucuronosyltransferase n=1 Tax=Oesophagostomum dentatum TaxID=61180 RepID=A0A0B1T1L9_OESDE|nr:hypothetical protein OESDEN_10869 [Oesophagostomum dentatum]